jgi:hypothetical protein
MTCGRKLAVHYKENGTGIQHRKMAINLWQQSKKSGTEFWNFQEPQGALIPRNRFLVRNQFRCGIDFWRHRFHVKEQNISELSSSYAVCGGRTFPTRKQYGSRPQGRWNVDSCFKNSHFRGHDRLDSILCSYTPLTLPKIPAQKQKLNEIYKKKLLIRWAAVILRVCSVQSYCCSGYHTYRSFQ